ncbi:hypothetical protein SCHPADRAFT_732272 [Schizopora paradoxa]|uniref:Uncharacterized protein n=1 Tax=Schizopora paradoxa TaxID=27342 RepID=A0A0H2R0G9_9AGAM|nr:hypothetical protein SCHPADRAFT_732272 [Schizopora paradoxa]
MLGKDFEIVSVRPLVVESGSRRIDNPATTSSRAGASILSLFPSSSFVLLPLRSFHLSTSLFRNNDGRCSSTHLYAFALSFFGASTTTRERRDWIPAQRTQNAACSYHLGVSTGNVALERRAISVRLGFARGTCIILTFYLVCASCAFLFTSLRFSYKFFTQPTSWYIHQPHPASVHPTPPTHKGRQ